ncbi:ABC transporter permease [Demequina maris]|uniref:ABC transporter permease n=1 Tax=Demequina maris TaxID=1638982 RepID=UPI0007804FFC|nr:ABC transporter permease [Demequina maris]
MSIAVAEARLTYGGAVRAELLKLTTTRGFVWVALWSLGPSALMLATSSAAPPADATVAEWTVMTIAGGILMPWVILAIYASLQATGEWTSGMFRVSFSIVPRRNLWLAAKATALAIFAGLVAIAVTALDTVIVLGKFGSQGATIDWTLGHTWQIFIGVPAVCIMTAVMAVGIGALVRTSGIAVTAVIVLLIVLPFAAFFGFEWVGHITSYLPSGAGDSVISSSAFGATSDDLGVIGGSLVMLAWSVGACVAASVAMNRRDA